MVCYNWVKQIQLAVLVRSEVLAGCAGYIDISRLIRAGAAVLGCVCTTILCYIFVRVFTCSHNRFSFQNADDVVT